MWFLIYIAGIFTGALGVLIFGLYLNAIEDNK